MINSGNYYGVSICAMCGVPVFNINDSGFDMSIDKTCRLLPICINCSKRFKKMRENCE